MLVSPFKLQLALKFSKLNHLQWALISKPFSAPVGLNNFARLFFALEKLSHNKPDNFLAPEAHIVLHPSIPRPIDFNSFSGSFQFSIPVRASISDWTPYNKIKTRTLTLFVYADISTHQSFCNVPIITKTSFLNI